MTATFLLLEGYSNFILACLLEPLRMLHERYGVDMTWRIVTADDRQVRSSSGLVLSPTHRLAEIDGQEMLIIISSNGFREHTSAENLRLVRALVRQSDVVVGADAGAWLLAATGVLDEATAAVHWSVASEFAETFPQVKISDARFVMEGKFWSCGGASAGLDLVRAFIAERFGASKAFAILSMFTHEPGGPTEGRNMRPALTDGTGGKLDGALSLMIGTIETPLPLDELASRALMSPRTLNRLFRSELGVSPKHYYRSLRLHRAQELAETTSLGLRDIALRCGYGSASSLCKAFRKLYGHPIRKSREMEQ